MASRKTKYCSFCGKREDEVFKMVEGPGANICDECVETAAAVVKAAKPASD